MKRFGRDKLADDPFQQFKLWFSDAQLRDDIQYAAAACLSTVSPEGYPEGRMVIVQDVASGAFTFCTDNRSPKSRALAGNPRAALTFYWGPLERQVRIQGTVESGDEEAADLCFQRRPKRSQITAWASRQSERLSDLRALVRRVEELDDKYQNAASVPRPPHWTSYRIIPRSIEFWCARSRRLHDRFLYRLDNDSWAIERLSP